MQSENINELAAALAKAQGAMKGAPKDATNPHFKSRYETLHSTVEAIREAFAANGLSFVQPFRSRDGHWVIVTRLLHASSGQFMEDDGVPLFPDKQNMQGLKSASTYARRIGLQCMAGVAPTDDDGNDAVDTPGKDMKPLEAPKTERKATNGGEGGKFEGQYTLMMASDGSQQAYPRSADGARQAVAMLERMAEDDPDNWEANKELARQIAKDFGKLKDEAHGNEAIATMTITERLKYLAETATQGNILNAG